MNENSQDKFFCPRLIDYIALVGSFSPLARNSSEISISQSGSANGINSEFIANAETAVKLNDLLSSGNCSVTNEGIVKPPLIRSSTVIGSISSSNTNSISHIQNPDLLRRYPSEDHNDFPLPKDIVCFCQPEGCITTTGKLSDYNKVSSFIFTISDKDTVRTRYGVCVNFYRPVKQKIKRTPVAAPDNVADSSDTSPEKCDRPSKNDCPNSNEIGANNNSEVIGKWSSVRSSHFKPRQKVQYNTLTSLCLVSHHPFFMAFRECLFYLKNLIDICNDSVSKIRDYHRNKRTSIWDILAHRPHVESPTIRHYIKEIEKWILRLLSAPVPVPGKTRVEIELYTSKETCPPLIFALPDHTRFSLIDFPLHLPLELLGIETCMRVLTLILLERKVVFQSRDYNALSMSVMAFIALIYPLEYMFPVIPLLPISLTHSECLLDNPTPYVVGIPINFFSLKKHFTLPDDIWLIDLDASKIISPERGRSGAGVLPSVPQSDANVLKNHLRQAVSRLSAGSLAFSSSEYERSAVQQSDCNNIDNLRQKFTKDRMIEYRHRGSSSANEDHYSQLEQSSIEEELSTTPVNTSMANPFDVDSVDVAIRVAMVKFFNSANMLANLTEHTRTIRLFPRPVVTVQRKSFIQSRQEITAFIEEFSRTQAVEYFAESALMPANVVFQRIQMGVTDPSLVGDKGKWFARNLEPIIFPIWSRSSFLENVFKLVDKKPETAETDPSGIDTDVEDNSVSPASSSDLEEEDGHPISSSDDKSTEIFCEDTGDVVYEPPCDLQIPFGADQSESPMMSSTTSASTESDLNSPEFRPSSLVNPDIIDVIIPQTADLKSCSSSTGHLDSIDKSSKIAVAGSFKSMKKKDSPSATSSFWTSIRRRSSSKDDDEYEKYYNDDDDDDERDGSIAGDIGLNQQLTRRKLNQEGILAQMDKITIHAKKAAGEASKSMQEVSKTALEASKTAAGVSKSTLEDLTYVGKNTLGDLTKSAKQVASKTRFLKVGLLSEFSANRVAVANELPAKISARVNSAGVKMLAEKSPLIRHSSPKRSDSIRSQQQQQQQQPGDKSLNSVENQNFLRDIAHQVLEGDSIGWLKVNRCRKLLEDENNRCLLLSKLNKTLDARINPSDYIEDVYVNKVTWRSLLKILQSAIHGLEVSFVNSSVGGMASVFHVLEIAHTHYWSKSGGDSSMISGIDSQLSSPFGSREDIQSPTTNSETFNSRKTSDTGNNTNSASTASSSGGKLSLQRSSTKDNNNGGSGSITDVLDVSNISTAADILRDLFNKRKESSAIVRSPSIETECLTDNSTRMSPESGNVSETGSMVTNPSYILQRMHKNNASFRSTVSDSEIEQTSISKSSKTNVPSAWSSKSSLSFRYNSAAIHNTLGFNNADSGRMYVFEGLVGKDRSSLWDKMEFWESAFIDAVSHERDVVGMDQGPEELMDRYKHLSEDEQRRLAHDEDRLLSTMLHNLIAFMVMMKVRKEAISSKVRSMLGKCRIAICYAEEIITLLGQLPTLEKNNVDLKCVASRLGHGQSFAVHSGIDATGILLFVEVRDDGLVMRTINGTVYERWWYERVINMTYSPKNKVLCLWKKIGGQTSLHKYYTKKSKQLYYCIKSAMERAVAQGQNIGQTVELGGEFPVKDLTSGEGGLLQVCMEGIGLLFCGSKFFVKLKRIRKCFTVKGRYFIFEEYNPKTRSITQRKYESSLAAQICYSVLCVFSYAAAVQHHKCTPQSLTPDTKQAVELAKIPPY